MAELSLIDYAVIFALILVSLSIGVYHAWNDRGKSNDEFLMGGRNMRTLPVCLSLMVSFVSPITLLGFPAEIYARGIHLWYSVVCSVIASVTAAEIFMPIYYRLRITSVNQYLHERYHSKPLRVIASVSIVLSMIPWMAVVLFAPALALEASTGLSITECILISGLLVTVYTSIGGLKAVVWTDVVQCVLMLLGIFSVIIKGTYDAGGFFEVWRKAGYAGRIQYYNFKFNMYMPNNFWTIVLGMGTIWTGGYSTSQMMVQRTCTLPTLRKAREVLYITLPIFQILNSLTCFMALVIIANLVTCDPIATGKIRRADELVPYFVTETFKDSFPGLPGLFVACVFSASLSTLSSGLNAMSALVWEDCLSHYLTHIGPKMSVLITKSIAALIGILCVGVAFVASTMGTVLEAANALAGAPVGPIFAIFFLGVFFPFANAKGAITATLLGQLLCLAINIGKETKPTRLDSFPPTVDQCPLSGSLLLNLNSTRTTVPYEFLRNYEILDYSPTGWYKIFHVSHFAIPFVGFLSSVIIGILVSLCTGGNKGKRIESKLFAPFVRTLYDLRVSHAPSGGTCVGIITAGGGCGGVGSGDADAQLKTMNEEKKLISVDTKI